MTASVPGEPNQSVAQQTGKATFPRSARLLRHADFERVYSQGRRHFSPSMTVFYLERGPEDPRTSATGLRIGFTVGRALGGAVQRNRMKRRLREAVRLTRSLQAPCVDVVINPKKTLLAADFAAIVNEVRQAFVVIEKKVAAREQVTAKTASESRKPASGSR